MVESFEFPFQTVVESAPNGLIMVDRSGKIALVNRETERLFGYDRRELLGQPLELLLPEAVGEHHDESGTNLFANLQSRAMGAGRDLFGRRKDGVEIPVEVGLNPIETEDRSFVVASVVDMSARRRAEDEVRRSNEELERFAYVVSHDLQEPLRTVVSYLELIERRYRTKLDQDAVEFIDFAVQGTRRMQRLIADLLTFSQVGAGAAPLVPTDAGAVLESALGDLQAAIAESGATVTRDRLPQVLADSTQLEQVFANLIGNALKFRGKAPPAIHVSAAQDGTRWIFRVRDNGIGIDPKYFDRVFVIFQRLHTREAYPGTGIGLAVCQKIIERHGGRIWVESQLGQGATFLFTLLGSLEK